MTHEQADEIVDGLSSAGSVFPRKLTEAEYSAFLDVTVSVGCFYPMIDLEYKPAYADLFCDQVQQDRLAALRAGAPLNAEEQQLWDDKCDSRTFYATAIWIEKIVSTRTKRAAYLLAQTVECGQGSDFVSAYAPTRNIKWLRDTILERTSDWFGLDCSIESQFPEERKLADEIQSLWQEQCIPTGDRLDKQLVEEIQQTVASAERWQAQAQLSGEP
ncbi:MAG: hypothetical protein KF784_06210 [Fimbriimonadaceae bacterium]|nr:hypothetical protein [Fimbriimonadaceae bacterium]